MSSETSAWEGLLARFSEQGLQKVSLGTEECTFASCNVHTVGSGSVHLVADTSLQVGGGLNAWSQMPVYCNSTGELNPSFGLAASSQL